MKPLKTGASIWVLVGNRETRVMRVPAEYPDHVIIPKRIYTEAMGHMVESGRTTGAAVIRRDDFNSEVWVNAVRKAIDKG